MKNLDKKSKEIFLKIYSLLKEEDYTELNNLDGVFMPLCVEKMGTIRINFIKWEKISISQYYVKNGEFYYYPEMIILYNKYLKNFICPVYFKHDNEDFKYSHINFEKENIKLVNNWLRNINNEYEL